MITHSCEYELKKKDGGGYLFREVPQRGVLCFFFIQASFPHVLSSLSNVSRYRSGSAAGVFRVIPLKIYDSHKKPETARAQAPGGAAVLESLFEGADRLTLKVRCDPQMCHLVQKKLLFFPPLPGSAFSDGT